MERPAGELINGATSLRPDALPFDADRFLQFCTSRRSIRRYQAGLIDRSLLERLIDAATRAPSNFNRQPWQFIVLDDPEWIAALMALLARGLDLVERRDTAGEHYNLLDHVRGWLHPLAGSAAIVLVFYKPSPERVDEMLASVLEGGSVAAYNPNLVSLGMAIQNLLLAAHAEGLGACMHSGPLAFLRGTVNRLLDLPQRLELAGLVSLGWPDEAPEAPAHRPVGCVLRYCEGPVPSAWSEAWADASA